MNLKEIDIQKSNTEIQKASAEQQVETFPNTLEQLHQMNLQKRLELENGLLKEELAKSSRMFSTLEGESKKQLMEMRKLMEEGTAQTRKYLQGMETENLILKKSLRDILRDYECDVVDRVTDATEKAFRSHEDTLKKSIEEMAGYNVRMLRELRESHQKMQEDYDLFFRVKGLREGIFWAGMVCTVVNLILLIICIARVLQ